MKLFKIKKQHLEISDDQIVADLDKLIAEPVAFRWNGRAHLIKVVSTADFLKATYALELCDLLRKKPGVNHNEILDSYHDVIKIVCDSISREDLNDMTLLQISALINLIVDSITGKSQVEKKNPQILKDQNLKG